MPFAKKHHALCQKTLTSCFDLARCPSHRKPHPHNGLAYLIFLNTVRALGSQLFLSVDRHPVVGPTTCAKP